MRTLQGAQILLPGSKERMEVGLLTSESLPLSLLSVPLAPAGKQQRPERERETAGEELKERGVAVCWGGDSLKAAGCIGKQSRKAVRILQIRGHSALGLSPRFPPWRPQHARP